MNEEQSLEIIELANEVDRLRFITEALLADLQDLLTQAPEPVQQYFRAKRVIHRTNVITYDVGRGCYLVNGVPMSLNIIVQALERDNPQLVQDVYALAPVFKI